MLSTTLSSIISPILLLLLISAPKGITFQPTHTNHFTSFQMITNLNPATEISKVLHRPITLLISKSSLMYKNHDVDEDVKRVVKRNKRVINSTPINNLIRIDTLDEYMSHLNKYNDTVVVARIHSPWCKVRNTDLYFSLNL